MEWSLHAVTVGGDLSPYLTRHMLWVDEFLFHPQGDGIHIYPCEHGIRSDFVSYGCLTPLCSTPRNMRFNIPSSLPCRKTLAS